MTDSKTWIIDPIDGTTNFIHQNPQICTILAFLVEKVVHYGSHISYSFFQKYISQEVKFGIVYNPITEEIWTAKIGFGAFYNGEKVYQIQ